MDYTMILCYHKNVIYKEVSSCIRMQHAGLRHERSWQQLEKSPSPIGE